MFIFIMFLYFGGIYKIKSHVYKEKNYDYNSVKFYKSLLSSVKWN